MSIPENDNQLWKGFNGHGLYAKRTERDRDGVIIDEAYARKSEIHQLENAVSDSTDTELTPGAAKTAIDGILKAPTPGAEGTMLSYGVTANEMKWDSWESEEFDVPASLLFLTYFNNFNNTTKIDTPLVGSPYVMQDQQSNTQPYTPSSLTISGIVYPAVYTAAEGQSQTSLRLVNEPIPSGTTVLSSEMWIYTGGTRDDFGGGLSLGVAPWITLDPLFTNYDFPLSGPSTSSCNKNYNLYNGSSVNSYYGVYFRFGTNIRLKTVHLAIVDCLETRDSWYYINGNLMYVLHTVTHANTYGYQLRQNNTGKSFTVTGIAIFAGDRRTNNGMNYPVPDGPYMQWPTA